MTLFDIVLLSALGWVAFAALLAERENRKLRLSVAALHGQVRATDQRLSLALSRAEEAESALDEIGLLSPRRGRRPS